MKALIGRVLGSDQIIREGIVFIDKGKILDVSRKVNKIILKDIEVMDFSDDIISPGYIDIHTHGGAGSDVMDSTKDSILKISKMHVKHGITGFLPTTNSSSKENILKSIKAIKEAIKINTGSSILGIHLEGPFLNKDKKGAQNPVYIISPKKEEFSDILVEGDGLIKIVTIAPEIEGAEEIIKILKKRNIVISVGHSNANYEQLTEAIELGATQITHIFNAMSELHHRAPGVSGGALILDRLKIQVIADGIHINPVIIKLILKAKGADRILLISDSMRAADLNDGNYISEGLKIIVNSKIARLESGLLAGSTLTLDKAVRNIVKWGCASISDAIKMASYNPAKEIGYGNTKGLIEKGRDADIVVLDNELNVLLTMIGGKVLHNNKV